MDTFGFVTKYSQTSNGTYTCSLVSYVTATKQEKNLNLTPSSSNFPIYSRFSIPLTTKTTTINCIGILNTNMIVSLNDPSQILIMSSDNKYIFIPLINNILASNAILQYYLMICSIIKYNTGIPLMDNFMGILEYAKSPKFKSSDTVYNSISTSDLSGTNLKSYYAMYLTGLNPPDELLTINSNKSQWNDIGYIFYTVYNYNVAAKKIDPKSDPTNILVPGNGIIPDNICIQTDSPTVIPSISAFDCRNVKNGSSYISHESNQTSQSCGSSSSSSSSLSFMLCIGLLVMSGIQLASATSKRK